MSVKTFFMVFRDSVFFSDIICYIKNVVFVRSVVVVTEPISSVTLFPCYSIFIKKTGYLLNATVIQYTPRNMHTVFALLCFVVVIHWLIFPYPSDLLHWHCGNLTIAPVRAKQPWWIWKNTSCEFIMNDCITTTKQSTTKPCAYFLGYTVYDRCRRHSAAISSYRID